MLTAFDPIVEVAQLVPAGAKLSKSQAQQLRKRTKKPNLELYTRIKLDEVN